MAMDADTHLALRLDRPPSKYLIRTTPHNPIRVLLQRDAKGAVTLLRSEQHRE
jgi:hypothetical protein